ncbi:lmo0937 family membrane protein [Clostridium bowmanii]|uniref:lmo0937 family membrane protein n=1 Tax=Clostridium bowmanii TaxID=132925 RepID=UPI001C0D9B73|nr:lmo0937 family membrane protein [Clostridium bowmanii]MBU3189550.1 lmo0937 family membrane protein [Clostridium bowmanii]MCA1073608.1 lmo0937 family membrane protein [Clostridium bowmanii]
MGFLSRIGGIIILFWFLGFMFNIGGQMIHWLLVIAAIVLIVDMISEKRRRT